MVYYKTNIKLSLQNVQIFISRQVKKVIQPDFVTHGISTLS